MPPNSTINIIFCPHYLNPLYLTTTPFQDHDCCATVVLPKGKRKKGKRIGGSESVDHRSRLGCAQPFVALDRSQERRLNRVIQSLLKGNPSSTSLWDNYKNQHSLKLPEDKPSNCFFLSSALSLLSCFLTLVISMPLFLSLSIWAFNFKESKYHLKTWTVGSHYALCRLECILCVLKQRTSQNLCLVL